MTDKTAKGVDTGLQRGAASGGGLDRSLAMAALLAAAALFIPLLLPLSTGRVFAADDLAVFHLPLRYLYATALAQGESILWSPHLFNGFYLHAEGQVGALHPLHLALYGLLPLVVAFNAELILSYVVNFCGMWVFLARLGLKRPAAITGATSFAFSGFNLLHLPHMNAVAVVSHLPWLLAATDVLISGPARWRPLAWGAISLLVGSQVLLGYPQYVWISAMSVATFGLARARDPHSWGRLALAAPAGVLGLAVGAAQLLPTLDLFGESVRPNASSAFALTFSLHPYNLLQLWSPYLFQYRVFALTEELFVHEFGLYSGALGTLSIAWVLFRWRQMQARQVAAFGLALSVAGLILALGRYGVVYEHFTVLPVVGTFRGPARHIVMVHLGLSLLLAASLDDLARMVKEGRQRSPAFPWAPVVVGLSAATAACAWLPAGVIPASLDLLFDRGGALAGVVLFGIAALLMGDAARGSHMALVALPLFAALDVGLWGYSYIWSRPPQRIPEVARMAEVPPAFGEGTRVHIGDLDARRNLGLLHGLKLLEPYVGLVPVRQLNANSEAAQRLGGVEWVHRGAEWARSPDPFPRARVLAEARHSVNPAMDVAAADLSRVALTSSPIAGLGQSSGDARVAADQAGRLEVDVRAGARAVLATTESYHAGWRATAEGRELATVRIYGDYLGVILEPGTYRLIVRFEPESARTGVAVSLGAFVLALGVASASLRPRFKRARGVTAS